MADIFAYLDWRADIPFSVDPFNEVDNLVLAELAYADFGGLVPAEGDAVPVQQVCEQFFKSHSREEILRSTSFTARAPLLMEGMLTGVRYRDMKLCGYINRISAEKGVQISAVTFLLGDGTAYVAFRGTDSSVVGWKEDFDLGCIDETAGQQYAVQYLEQSASRLPYPLRVGGHSKGGNFAVYAAAFCDPSVQERLIKVYTNDGPGFRAELIRTDGYLRILPKIVSIIPDTSIIGLLLSTGATHRVVQSDAVGILQHDGFSWNVQRNHFVDAELSELGKLLDRTLDSWVDSMDDETRRSLTETVFSMIEATGKDTFHEIGMQKMKSAEAMLNSLRALPKERQSELIRHARKLLQSGGQAALAQLPDFLPARKNE